MQLSQQHKARVWGKRWLVHHEWAGLSVWMEKSPQSSRSYRLWMSIINVFSCGDEIKKKKKSSHCLMNLISLTSNSQSNEIKLGECSIRTMKSAPANTRCRHARNKRTPTHIAGSLDCSLDCFLIKQSGGGTNGLSNNFMYFYFFFIHFCLSSPWQQKREGKKRTY